MNDIPVINSPTVEAIYAHHAKRKAAEGQWDSYGIAFSMLGDECDRHLWYAHHWAFKQKPVDGKKARLFQTGSREEDRIIAELKAIGVDITNEQMKVKLCDGHLRGKIEGEALGLPEAPKTKHTLEIKTHKNTSFNAIVKHGLPKQNPKHYVQTMLGAYGAGNARAMYIMNCKNSDDLHTIRFTVDPVEIAQWLARAERIIKADSPLPKLHEDPEKKAAFKCKTCPAKGVCHDGEFARINCRTCLHSSPVADGGWHCDRHKMPIPRDVQRDGCVEHRFIPGLVPGIQTDFDPDGAVITYALHRGEQWKDSGAYIDSLGCLVKA